LLDWKNLGVEYSKARQLALRRAYPDAFPHEGDELYEFSEIDYFAGIERTKLGSMPASPRLRGMATPGDLGTLTEDVRYSLSSHTSALLILRIDARSRL
jgi:glycogen(starch) synthase